MNIVLLEPEIPMNTGNIGRTCSAAGASLHLIKPLGFSLDDKYLKRSGLDYWHELDVKVYDDFTAFLAQNNNPPLFPATTKAKRIYTEIAYPKDAYIIFGKESAGLPEPLLLKYRDTCARIPMLDDTRSLNLSVSVAIILYEALRRHDFPSLKREGRLRSGEWDF